MKKIFSFTLLPAALLGAAFVFLSPKDLPAQKVTLTEMDGGVQYQAASTEAWVDANTGMELHENDSIKTGADGQVTIIFHDSSSSRLGRNSEILIENASLDETTQTIGVRLASGRVWSRILKLLDKDTTFEIRTSSTVATVRGTTLDVAVDEAETATVSVAEGVVDVVAVETERVADEKTGKPRFKIAKKLAKVKVEKDKMVEIPKNKTGNLAEVAIAVQEIREEVKKADWFQNNTRKDEEFEKRAREKILDRVKQESGILPDSPFYRLKRAAEEISMKIPAPSEKKQELIERFAERRLKEAVIMNEGGNTDLGKRALEDYKEATKNLPPELSQLPEHLPKVAEWLTKKPFLADAIKDARPKIKEKIIEAVHPAQEKPEEIRQPVPPPLEIKPIQPGARIEQPKPVDQEKIRALRSNFESLGDMYAKIILLADNAQAEEAQRLLETFRSRAETLARESSAYLAADADLRALVGQMKEYTAIARDRIANPSPRNDAPAESMTEDSTPTLNEARAQ
ncbi:MAG: DUF5667 domain-containing protein [Patescibacteria group bacterium]